LSNQAVNNIDAERKETGSMP